MDKYRIRFSRSIKKIKKLNLDPVYLFVGKTGSFLGTQDINKHLKIACDALDINYFPSHKIRATIATEAIRAGMDEVTAMYTFGWKDLDTVKAYVRAGRTEANQQSAFLSFL